MRALLLGGLLPVVVFTVIEEVYGTVAGLIAGMIFGVGEILYEKFKLGRVEKFTWIGNGMLLVLGGISLFTAEGYWFKLQPSLLEVGMAAVLLISLRAETPLFVQMMQKQGSWQKIHPALQPVLSQKFKKMTVRMSLFLCAHAGLSAYAAFYWSTRAWAILKGVGFTLSLALYMVVETIALRYKLRLIK